MRRLDETHARGAQIRYVIRTYVSLFGDRACTTGRWAFGCSETVISEYMKSSVPWKRIHHAGLLD